MIVPVFLTGLGCSKSPCVFCNQEVATSNSSVFSIDAAKQRIEETLALYITGKEEIKYPLEVAFYGSSFTALEFSMQKEILKSLQSSFEKITSKDHRGNLKIRISTRPDCIKREELLDLKIRFNLTTVEIGVQSMVEDVLLMSNRGHSRKDVKTAAKIIKELGLELSCHQMIGLPGSTINDELNTAKDIIKLKPKFMRLHPTLVLKGTALETMFLSGSYKPLELDIAVDVTEQVLRLYRQAGISVIRIGMHPSDLLTENVVAGPWHPAFRELVEGKYLMNEASRELTDYQGQRVQLSVAPQDETYIRGENNTNYTSLLKSFGLKNLEIVKDPKMQRGSVSIKEITN
jgi:histone acetyltransferase (RNA polymerase elongator complex component)